MDVFDPLYWLSFVHLHLFRREWIDLHLTENDLRALEIAILAGPERNPVVPGTEGLRKIRFAGLATSRGKSGAFRIGYVYFPDHGKVVLVTVWGKNEKSNLSKADRNAIARVIREIQAQLERGDVR